MELSNSDLFDLLNTKQHNIKEIDEDICQNCKKTKNIIVLDGQMICQHCGDVQDEVLDYGAEYRYYGAEDTKSSDPTRCGMPTNSLFQNHHKDLQFLINGVKPMK